MNDPRTDTDADTSARTITRLTMDVASAQSRAKTAERQRTATVVELHEMNERAEKAEAERDRYRAVVRMLDTTCYRELCAVPVNDRCGNCIGCRAMAALGGREE